MIEVSAFGGREGTDLLARAGPGEAWDFEPYLQKVLNECARQDPRPPGTARLRVVCLGRHSISTPSFGINRLTLGLLVALDACIELHLVRSDGPTDERPMQAGAMPRIRVHFTLETRSDYDPREISRLTALEPSRQIRKGETQAINGQPSASTRWTVETSERNADSFDALLDEILALLEPHAGPISALTAHELVGVLSLVGYFSGPAPLVRFRSDQLRIARQLGVQIDVDLIPTSPDD